MEAIDITFGKTVKICETALPDKGIDRAYAEETSHLEVSKAGFAVLRVGNDAAPDSHVNLVNDGTVLTSETRPDMNIIEKSRHDQRFRNHNAAAHTDRFGSQ